MSKCEKCGREGCPNIDTYSCVRIQRDTLQARVAAQAKALVNIRQWAECREDCFDIVHACNLALGKEPSK